MIWSRRGFDTFLGYYGAFVSYFSYVDGLGACENPTCFYDMHDGDVAVPAGSDSGESSPLVVVSGSMPRSECVRVWFHTRRVWGGGAAGCRWAASVGTGGA